MKKTDIKSFTLEELKKVLTGLKAHPYRANQIFTWIYKAGIYSFNEMTNMPNALRGRLAQSYYISALEVVEHLKSADGTEKFLFRLRDSRFIEAVLIYAEKRKTVCLSTQVGCKFACPFCASGSKGFIRNLTAPEIINQILYLRNNLKHKITNYVFMGMGEPLDNYDSVSRAILIMNEPGGMNIGAGRITVSTCGIIPGIEKLKHLGLQINLSVSLHAADNKLRDNLMPVNKKYPLEKLIRACEDFINKTRMTITLEYVLLEGVNDSSGDADGLSKIARRLKAGVNLIPYSEVSGFAFRRPAGNIINTFMERLVNNGIGVTLRKSKGRDIGAACGQLAGRKKNEI